MKDKLRHIVGRLRKSPLGDISGLFFYVLAGVIAMGCANRGAGPQGGPKDETPPELLRAIPENGAVNFGKNRIELLFDEIVLIEKAYENVVVSPPQMRPASVKAIGKKVVITFNDSIKENTTYTIDFGDAIVDNNEKNPLVDYSFSFASGGQIDTLQMQGILIDSETLNPISKRMIGIHSDLTDSAFITKPFDRITKTDAQGRFTVKNIRPGSYRIYALDDIGGNFRYDQPNEQIAFLATIFEPKALTTLRTDTVWRDTVIPHDDHVHTERIVDSIIEKITTRFLPDSILLKAFTQVYHKQYLIKSERTEPYRFSLYFNEASDSLPRITALNFSFDNAVLLQSNVSQDTLHYWLTDTTAWNVDTLRLSLHYLKTDSTNQLIPQIDTLALVMRGGRNTDNSSVAAGRAAARGRRQSTQKVDFLKVTTNLSAKFDVYKPIEIIFETPTLIGDASKIKLEQKIDTIFRPISITLIPGDSIGLRYLIKHTFKPEEAYRLTIDSAACQELYGKHNNKLLTDFSIKSLDDYAGLVFEIANFTGKEIVEILDKDEKIVRSQKATEMFVRFEYLNPGDYYARIIVDENQNGHWDPGNFLKNRQAENVYYYPYKITLRAFWNLEEYWDYLEIPLLEQKPRELIKDLK